MNANWADKCNVRRGPTKFLAIVVVLAALGVKTPLQGQQAEVATIVAGNNQFAFDMYHRLRESQSVGEHHGNLIFFFSMPTTHFIS